MDTEEHLWGKFTGEEQPLTHFDPLQTFIHDGKAIGYRIHIVASRGNRPRENKLPRKEEKKKQAVYDENYINSSILQQVIHGKLKCVPIAGDTTVLGSPTEEPGFVDLSSYRAVAIMNKYPALGILSEQASGAALVVYPTTYVETLENPSLNTDILVALRTALKALLEDNLYREDLYTALVFFNIGPSSGASLRQLHAQAYCMPEANGLITHGFYQAFRQNKYCLGCRMGKETEVTDLIGQNIPVKDLTIWEDENVRLLVPFAPIRTFALRVLPKVHCSYVGKCDDKILASVGKGMAIAHKTMALAVPRSWKLRPDRTVAFRQTPDVRKDFHFFVDVLPTIPFGGEEVIDFLSVSSFHPLDVAERMRRIVEERILPEIE